ncbi:putative secreted protein (Por secretion system target) [Mariniflexile fucanivorans]|uniref:Putative secreted protein (Por secretion system target) n=2 Tax=Mariniflexile fucanivorans TaxID=264023 RepID=A0A4R1RHL4_9FLAO|nr:putative secreted protein (Por secretion system target) [Mariniflexile fucanivorans]
MKKLLKKLSFVAIVSLIVATVQAQDPNAWLHVQFENNLNGTTNVGATPGMTLPVAFQVIGSDVSPALYNSGTPKEGSYALDFSSYPVDGTGAYTGSEGLISNSLDAKIESDNALFITGNSARTFAAWIRFDDISSGGGSHVILNMGDRFSAAQGRVTWTLDGANNRIQIAVGGGNVNGNYDVNGITTPSLEEVGVWHHVAFTYAGGTTLNDVKFYIDGVQTTNDGGSSTVAFNTTSDKLVIGSRGHQNNSQKWFDGGGIDDLRVYDSALSAAQITSIYGGGYLSVGDIAFGENELNAYPNAVEDFLYLETTTNSSLHISVFDITGKNIIRTFGKSVDMRGLTSGLYIVKVREDNKVANLKILKK